MNEETETIVVKVPKSQAEWYRNLFQAAIAPETAEHGLLLVAYTHGEAGSEMHMKQFVGRVPNYGSSIHMNGHAICGMCGAIETAAGAIVGGIAQLNPGKLVAVNAAVQAGKLFVLNASYAHGKSYGEVLAKLPPEAFGKGDLG